MHRALAGDVTKIFSSASIGFVYGPPPMTRALTLLVLFVVACAEPYRPPVQHRPADPNAVNGCRSSQSALGGMFYRCATYELVDSVAKPSSIYSIAQRLKAAAQAKGFETSTKPAEVKGAEDALIIEYRKGEHRAFDLVVMNAVDGNSRMIQCHVPSYKSASARPKYEETCTQTIGLLLQRPAPPAADPSPECVRAAHHVAKLPGRPADGGDELSAVQDFLGRCTTETVATCALASVSYVEATLCRN